MTGPLQIIARHFFSFSSLSPPLLSWKSLRQKTKRSRSRERERTIASSSISSEQHFSIRRIIHFFSPPSLLGRSFFFTHHGWVVFFFSLSLLRVHKTPGHSVLGWAGFRSIDSIRGRQTVEWVGANGRYEIGENSSPLFHRHSNESLTPFLLEINRSINLPSILLFRQKFFITPSPSEKSSFL